MSNLPIFRGIDIKTGEVCIGKSILTDVWGNVHLIDEIRNGFNWDMCHSVFPDTIAIHFPDMLANDSYRYLANGEKDLRIFASLQEDGKGGDLIDNFNFQKKYRIQTAIYKYNCFHLIDKDGDTYSLIECKLQKGIKIIGI